LETVVRVFAMARIEGVPRREAGLLARWAYRYSERKFARVLTPVSILAHHPRILIAHAAYETLAAKAVRVPAKLKHLAEMHVARFFFGLTAKAGRLEAQTRRVNGLPALRAARLFADTAVGDLAAHNAVGVISLCVRSGHGPTPEESVAAICSEAFT
jgi:hypothetical protein